jgi:hypothetical protein
MNGDPRPTPPTVSGNAMTDNEWTPGTLYWYEDEIERLQTEIDRLRDLLVFNFINPDAVVESAKGMGNETSAQMAGHN